MTDSPPHDWFRPRLAALVAAAESAGFARDVSVAVITDLINGPAFSTAPEVVDENWNQDEGEPAFMVNALPGGGTADPASLDGAGGHGPPHATEGGGHHNRL